MRWLEVNSSQPLKGKIRIPGSKNSSLALLAASCLADEPVHISRIPDISDIQIVFRIMKSIGVSISGGNGLYTIDPSGIHTADIDPALSSAFRAAYYFVGALLAKYRRVSIGYPGGDNFVSRPIDQHIKGLRALGARVEMHEDHYVVEADQLRGAEIFFDVMTCGATVNVMLAAVLAKGRTTLYNAARDPEVVDTAVMLNKMGARIYGAGTDTIRIIGVDRLGGCTHTPAPDRLIAGAYLIAAGVTGGIITIEDVIPKHLEPCMTKLSEIGLSFEQKENSITVDGTGRIRAARIRTGKYPMFESDFQQPVTTLLLKAHGRSTISDRVYPMRFNHVEQLRRMGADIEAVNGTARINSFRKLTGTWVHAADIRAGTALVLAGLMAEGTTRITGVEHIERGYEDIVRDFRQLGADISLVTGSMPGTGDAMLLDI
ncbi:MAG TPA: UDP-N-acetylglucosamine 1-carboxyvinyltransferase [Clostridiales bacterium]|nr:UDP-N-acetylglucosamine 1-carboxyvinyltransferase [Clostridiales bacterium]